MGELKRHDRSAVVEALGDDLVAISTTLDEAHGGVTKIEDVLCEMGEGELVDWVAVAVHRMPDGSSKTRIHGHPDRTALQVKGLLHDAVWAAAHRE